MNRKLLISVLSIVVLFGVLLGATYAWFGNIDFQGAEFRVVAEEDIAVSKPDGAALTAIMSDIKPTAYNYYTPYFDGDTIDPSYIDKLLEDERAVRVPIKISLLNAWPGKIFARVAKSSKSTDYDELMGVMHLAIFGGIEVNPDMEGANGIEDLLVCGSFADFETAIEVISDGTVFVERGFDFVTLVIWLDGPSVDDSHLNKTIGADIMFTSGQ